MSCGGAANWFVELLREDARSILRVSRVKYLVLVIIVVDIVSPSSFYCVEGRERIRRRAVRHRCSEFGE